MADPITTRSFQVDDYRSVVQLWQNSEGVEVAEGDDEGSITEYLKRNPNLSRLAVRGNEVVAAVLCGHDGRRALIYHLAVRADHRGKGLGKQLVEECLTGLRACGLKRALIFVAKDNAPGRDFWIEQGFDEISGATSFGVDLV